MNIGVSFRDIKPCPRCEKGTLYWDGKVLRCINCAREADKEVPDFILQEIETKIKKGTHMGARGRGKEVKSVISNNIC